MKNWCKAIGTVAAAFGGVYGLVYGIINYPIWTSWVLFLLMFVAAVISFKKVLDA